MKYNNFIKSLLLFVPFAPAAGAFAQDSMSCRGNILIANWSPSEGSGGAHIASVSVHYHFGFDSLELTKRFKLKWYLGDFVIIHGRKYMKDDVPQNLFQDISIENVSFSAEVWSEGKHVDDIIIEYPALAPRSGSESGWYITGSASWNKVFTGLDDKKAAEICGKGFDLKNPKLQHISFGGLDAIEAAMKQEPGDSVALTSPRDSTAARAGGNGTHGRKSKKRRPGKVGAFLREIDLDMRTGRINEYKENSWHIDLNSGLGCLGFPINVNKTAIADSISRRGFGFGPGLQGGVELWPFFGNHWGIGAAGNALFSWAPRSMVAYTADYGAQGYLGAIPFHLLLGWANGYRTVKYRVEGSNGSSGTLSVGESDYTTTTYKVGIRTWIGNEKSHMVDAVIYFENPSFDVGPQWITLWNISLWLPNSFRTGFVFSLDYPSPGEVLYEKEAGYKDHGLFFGINFSKGFDFFGRPYRTKRI